MSIVDQYPREAPAPPGAGTPRRTRTLFQAPCTLDPISTPASLAIGTRQPRKEPARQRKRYPGFPPLNPCNSTSPTPASPPPPRSQARGCRESRYPNPHTPSGRSFPEPHRCALRCGQNHRAEPVRQPGAEEAQAGAHDQSQPVPSPICMRLLRHAVGAHSRHDKAHEQKQIP